MRTQRPFAFKAFNRAGWLLETTGILKLRCVEDALLNAARRHTGLDDFGDDGFREPLRRLIDSLNREARLNLAGKLAARHEILQLLINRLHLQRDRRAHPEIAAQAIVKPLFIIGLPRTGTTLLHSLLALDPANRSPLTWEVMYPSPANTQDSRRRIDRAARNLAWLDRIAPDFKAIHLLGAQLPQECVAILSHTFLSDEFNIMFNVPAYAAWMECRDMLPAYAYHRQFLQHLQYSRPAQRWVLKAPFHMLWLNELFCTYPDARVVQTHREPLDVMASTTSLTVVLRSTFSDFVDKESIARELSILWAETLESFMRTRENLPGEQFFDLHFEEILRDPIDAVRRLYHHFGNDLSKETETRMREFLALNPKDKHGRHLYTLEQFGLDPVEEIPRFRNYRERFQIAGPALQAAP
jgi:hypothetical protein